MANTSKVERASWSIRVTVATSPGVWAFRSFNSLRHSGRAPLTFSRKSWRPFGAHGQSKTLRKNSKSMFWKIGTARRDLALLLK
jgi:hypothetical protein